MCFISIKLQNSFETGYVHQIPIKETQNINKSPKLTIIKTKV